jgi:hypothetical protein
MLATLTQSAQSNFTNTVQFIGSIPAPYWKRAALSVGLPGSTLDVQSMAQEMSSAQRGEIVPTTLGIGAGVAVAPVLQGAMAMGISTAAAAIGISIPGIGTLAWLASLYPDAAIGAGARNTVRAMTDLGRQIRHLEFGGHYTDTETAQRLRMQAFYEMSGATSAARRYLGQEAYFLHR